MTEGREFLLETWRRFPDLPPVLVVLKSTRGMVLSFIPRMPLSGRLSRHVIPLCSQGQAATRWASPSLDRAGCHGFVAPARVAPGG